MEINYYFVNYAKNLILLLSFYSFIKLCFKE